MKTETIKRIVWSVDAFQDAGKIQELVAKSIGVLLRQIAAQTQIQVQVEPVYVLTPEQLNLSVGSEAASVDNYKHAAEKSAERLTEQLIKNIDGKLNWLLPPKVLIQHHFSTAAAVQSLAAYALSSGANLIVVGTHGRSGMPRFFMGSFAESLLLYSKVPVMVVGPKSEELNNYEHILFPTDLGKNSRPALEHVTTLAKSLRSKLTIYHSIQNPIEPVLQSGVYLLGGGWLPVPAYMEEEMNKRGNVIDKLVQIARNSGVEADGVVEPGRGGVVTSILSFAEKNNLSLIAMTAQSGPVASSLIGSITRQVVRESGCPVWVIRLVAKKSK